MDTPVSVLLNEKGHTVYTILPNENIYACIQKMAEFKVGALLVFENGELHGIISERDVLWKTISHGDDINQTKVSDIMTKSLFTITPKTTVREAMSIVTNRRCRHLPVLEHGKLVGVISIGDLTRWALMLQEEQILSLKNYIYR